VPIFSGGGPASGQPSFLISGVCVYLLFGRGVLFFIQVEEHDCRTTGTVARRRPEMFYEGPFRG